MNMLKLARDLGETIWGEVIDIHTIGEYDIIEYRQKEQDREAVEAV